MRFRLASKRTGLSYTLLLSLGAILLACSTGPAVESGGQPIVPGAAGISGASPAGGTPGSSGASPMAGGMTGNGGTNPTGGTPGMGAGGFPTGAGGVASGAGGI
jgi:hypothetical protein